MLLPDSAHLPACGDDLWRSPARGSHRQMQPRKSLCAIGRGSTVVITAFMGGRPAGPASSQAVRADARHTSESFSAAAARQPQSVPLWQQSNPTSSGIRPTSCGGRPECAAWSQVSGQMPSSRIGRDSKLSSIGTLFSRFLILITAWHLDRDDKQAMRIRVLSTSPTAWMTEEPPLETSFIVYDEDKVRTGDAFCRRVRHGRTYLRLRSWAPQNSRDGKT